MPIKVIIIKRNVNQCFGKQNKSFTMIKCKIKIGQKHVVRCIWPDYLIIKVRTHTTLQGNSQVSARLPATIQISCKMTCSGGLGQQFFLSSLMQAIHMSQWMQLRHRGQHWLTMRKCSLKHEYLITMAIADI